MKTLKTSLFITIALFIISCSGGGKFEGKWSSVNSRFGSETITIEKSGDIYKVLSEEGMNVGSFNYDKKKDALILEAGGEFVEILYNDNTGNISFGNSKVGMIVELQKVK